MLPWLRTDTPFPPVESALDDPAGLLAAGADLSVARLLDAYRQGIFPWYSPGQPIFWWSTHPRMVLRVTDFRCHRSLRQRIRQILPDPAWELSCNRHFVGVIQACAEQVRHGQAGTWISDDMIAAYIALHEAGHVHSIETWQDGQLVAGLYGVAIGRMFFGESMFTRVNDGSKLALAALVGFLREQGCELIDCQQQTNHLASLGAAPIPRAAFSAHLAKVTPTVEMDWLSLQNPRHNNTTLKTILNTHFA